MENQEFTKLLQDLKNGGFIYNDSDLCRKLGCSKSFLSEMKGGKRPITEQFVTRLRVAFPSFFNPEAKDDGDGCDNSKAVDVLKEQVEKKDQEIDRLLSIIEALSGAQKKAV